MPSSVLALGLRALVAGAALTLVLPAWSQGSPGGGSGATSSPAAGSGMQPRASQRAADEEREMIEEVAHAHLAEIETGRLALQKTQNAQVRGFAQQMIDEHTQGLQELQQLGQKRKLALPTETDFQHKAIATAMRLLSGDTFNRQYIRQAGIKDHRRTVDLLMKLQQTSQDADWKAYADKQLPIVERHLGLAREMDQKMR